MSDRTFKVCLVDDHEDSLSGLHLRLTRERFHFPVKFHAHYVNGDDTNLASLLADRNDDMYVLDQMLPGDTKGTDIAKHLIGVHPQHPPGIIILSAAEPSGLMDAYRDLRQSCPPGTFEVLQKIRDRVEDTIVKIARKPLILGIDGGGNFGLSFLSRALQSGEVSHTYIHSRHRGDAIPSLLETVPGSPSKVTLCKDLESVLENCDVLLSASTSIDPSDADKVVANTSERNEFLQYEKDGLMRKFRLVANTSRFKGPICHVTNPPAGSAVCADFSGIDPYRSFFSGVIDAARMKKALEITDPELSVQYAPWINQIGHYLFAAHGAPRTVFPREYSVSVREQQWVLNARNEAADMGKISRTASREIGFPSVEPALRAFEVIIDFYSFRSPLTTNTGVYCELPRKPDGRIVRGRSLLPARALYTADSIRISPDESAIEDIGRERIFGRGFGAANVVKFLANQQAYYYAVLQDDLQNRFK